MRTRTPQAPPLMLSLPPSRPAHHRMACPFPSTPPSPPLSLAPLLHYAPAAPAPTSTCIVPQQQHRLRSASLLNLSVDMAIIRPMAIIKARLELGRPLRGQQHCVPHPTISLCCSPSAHRPAASQHHALSPANTSARRAPAIQRPNPP